MLLSEDEIFGLAVGSTEPFFLAVLAVHVLVALVAVVTGAIAMLSRKGEHRHVHAGRWYYRAICAVFVTATILAILRWAEDYYLFLIGSVAFVSATFGYLHRRLKRPGDAPHIIGMGVSYVAMLTAFYVDNGPNLPIWNLLPRWAFWVLPAAVGIPLIGRAVWRHRRGGVPAPNSASSGPLA